MTVNTRFGSVLPIVQRKVQAAGLSVRMGLEDVTGTRAQMVLRFRVPVDRTKDYRLSQALGTLKAWSQTDRAPAATRVTVGGSGKGLARIFRSRDRRRR